jgi:uncharacterized RDD family membrane protein YckC
VDYHLSIAGERTGPHTQFHIIEGIRDERLKGDELVWRLGMEEWRPLRTMQEFEDFWPVSEDTRLQAEAARNLARAELDRPRPWMRFWARVLDYMWFSLTLVLVVGSWLPAMPPPRNMPLLEQLLLESLALLPLLLYVPVEAWMLSRFGSTPGRALLCVQVRRLDGGLPTFTQALRRSFQVYVRGLALGLPLVYLVAMMWSRVTLLQRGATPWDETNETRVEHGEPEIWRYLVLAGILLGVFVTAMLVAGRVAEDMSHLPK